MALSTGFLLGFIAGACAMLGVILWTLSDPASMNRP